METFGAPSSDAAAQWRIEKASEACNAEIDRKRWGSVAAMLSYQRQESDHGYRACMNARLKKNSTASAAPDG
jgi:hypothetical protein